MRLALAFLFCFSLKLFATDVIPADRRIDWGSYVGIPGGIPTNYTTVSTNLTGIDNTGATDVTTAIQNALNGAAPYCSVNLPSGRFKITSTLTVPSFVVLRGAGWTSRLIMAFTVSSSAPGIRLGPALGGDTTWGIASTAVKGTNSLVLSNVTGLAISNIVYIEQLNDSNLVSNGSTEGANPGQDLYFGSSYNLAQPFEIIAINGNTITFQPPLNYTWTNSLGAQIHRKGNGDYAKWMGVEDLAIEQTSANGDKNFNVQHAKYWWLKHVESTNVYKYHCQIEGGFRGVIRDSYLHDSQGSSSGGNYGISVAYAAGFNLIENNVINNCITALLLTEMAQGNVFGYNYIPHVQYSPTNWLQADMTSHDCHPMMNLFEGNVAHMYVGDYIHGSSSHQTLFRNRLEGCQAGTDTQNRSVMLDEFNQYNNIIGNVLGSPVASAAYEAIGPSNLPDTTPVLYQLGYGQLSGGSFVFITTNVSFNTLRKGNYCICATSTNIPAAESIGSTNLDDSLYLTGKPSWFGTNRWPPIQANAAVVQARIPAQNTFDGIDNGVTGGGGGGGTTNRVSISGNVSVVGATF